MGNCIDHDAMLSWAEEEEELGKPRKSKPKRRQASSAVADTTVGRGKAWTTSVGAPATHAEVKIKVTKQQLEELLRSVGEEGGALPVQQVLLRLVGGGGGGGPAHWRPALQSIPETAES